MFTQDSGIRLHSPPSYNLQSMNTFQIWLMAACIMNYFLTLLPFFFDALLLRFHPLPCIWLWIPEAHLIVFRPRHVAGINLAAHRFLSYVWNSRMEMNEFIGFYAWNVRADHYRLVTYEMRNCVWCVLEWMNQSQFDLSIIVRDLQWDWQAGIQSLPIRWWCCAIFPYGSFI